MIFIVVSGMLFFLHVFFSFRSFVNPHSMSILLSKEDIHLLWGFEDGVKIFLSVYIFSLYLVLQYLLYKYALSVRSLISPDVHSPSN
jgi:hypothetical protein